MNMQTSPQITLQAETGCYLYNGETVGTIVILPNEEAKNNWREITQAEYEAMLAKENGATEGV